MVYIRTKKVKSDQYLYLVKSIWDSKKYTSKQEIVKYLGKASEVVNDDIPVPRSPELFPRLPTSVALPSVENEYL